MQRKKFAYFPLFLSCRDCLTEHIRLATDPEVQCPHQDDDYACHATITGQEIQAVSNGLDISLKWLKRREMILVAYCSYVLLISEKQIYDKSG